MSSKSLGRGRGASLKTIIAGNKKTSNGLNSANAATDRAGATNRKQDEVVTIAHEQFETLESGDFNYDDLLRKVTASYTVEESDEKSSCLGQTKEIFNSMVATEANVCLICLDSIERGQQIWNCGSCFCMLHLTCIQQWISEGAYQQKLSTLSQQHFPNKRPPWNCPKCRTEYSPSLNPSVYRCFCGKLENPPDDPWITPHSCGDTCNKLLKPECGHKCLLLCHPGPCPPCPKSVSVTCFCGQQPRTRRRCAARNWSCSLKCSKLLECRQHKCQQLCHPGECKPCPETSIQPCLCGKKRKSRPCAEPAWSCEQVCGRLLNCGNHRCEKICHSVDDCGTCDRASRTRYCPCGKTSVTDIPCTDDVPCCGDTCSKPLSCKTHSCTEKCHTGSCGQCLQMSIKSCRCGAKQKEMPCAKTFTCDTKCQNMKSCGRHQCKRRCCDGVSCLDCDQPCGRKLNCGNHKCTSTCHDGKCYPCPLTVTKSCPCGQTVISVPCIRQKTARPPKCRVPCKKPSICDHPSIQKHYCHSGDCPPCSLVCGKQLLRCSHTCDSRCHDAVRVVRKETRQVSGPWEQKPLYYTEIVCQPCPPCPVPVPVTCWGGHETVDLVCSSCQVYSCGRKCGRQLTCTNHMCEFTCHQVTGATDSKTAGAECQECEGGCTKPRPDGCSHECLRSCHPGNCPKCKQMIRTRCHCGVTVLHFPCFEWTSTDFDKKEKLKCPGDCPKLLACGHQCSGSCHPGNCDNNCSRKVTMKCACKLRKVAYPCNEVRMDNFPGVKCTDECRKKKATQTKEEAECDATSAELAAADSELSADLHLLPGRRQRRRKEKMTEEVEEKGGIRWDKVGQYSLKLAAVLALLIAFYWALTAEN